MSDGQHRNDFRACERHGGRDGVSRVLCDDCRVLDSPMNIAAAIRRHEDLAFWFARIGKAKAARAELLRIEQLKKLRELKRKNPTYRMFDDAVNADNYEDSREVYGDADDRRQEL